jgi:nucleoside 2-deoxyribosyltransferase
MSGLPDHGYSAFEAAALSWREAGYEVVSPHELNDPAKTHEELAATPWADYLRRDLRALLDCDGVVALPGWEASAGASLEIHVARALGMPVVHDAKREPKR